MMVHLDVCSLNHIEKIQSVVSIYNLSEYSTLLLLSQWTPTCQILETRDPTHHTGTGTPEAENYMGTGELSPGGSAGISP